MSRRGICFGILLLTGSTAGWSDAGFTFNGTTVGGPTMTVPSDVDSLSTRHGHFSYQPFFPGPVDETFSCDIFGVQDGPAASPNHDDQADGVLLVYKNSFNPAAPLNNLIAFNDDAAPGEYGASRILDLDLDFQDNYYLVTVSYDLNTASTFSNHIQCLDNATRILPGDGNLYLGNTGTANFNGRVSEVGGGRFQVSVTWKNFAQVTGAGFAVPVGSNDSALFYFFEPQNWELMVKVIDGCGLNSHYWVYMAATTNVEFHLVIRDTRNTPNTIDDVFYFVNNALGSFANSLRQDINAFGTCPI